MIVALWVSLFLIFYTFFGYGIPLYLLLKVPTIIKGKRPMPYSGGKWPSVTLVVPAYNAESCIAYN